MRFCERKTRRQFVFLPRYRVQNVATLITRNEDFAVNDPRNLSRISAHTIEDALAAYLRLAQEKLGEPLPVRCDRRLARILDSWWAWKYRCGPWADWKEGRVALLPLPPKKRWWGEVQAPRLGIVRIA